MYRTGARSFLLAYLATVLGCAHTGDSQGDARPKATNTSEEVETNTAALRVPKIVPVMPESGVIDLGPVLIQATVARSTDYMTALVVAADSLGADAFLADSKLLKESYRFRPLMGKNLMDPTTRPVSADDLIYHGPYSASGDPTPDKEFFYHALKFVEGDVVPCVIAEGLLPQPIHSVVQNQSTLQAQFVALIGAFAEGFIDVETFESARLECVRQLRAGSTPARRDPPP
ncbi:MAG: hypothetical protein AAF658_04270 [Myxococcota bacterium]